jgi:hypothetical protein
MWCSVHVWGVRDGKGMGRRLRGVEGSRYVYRVARYGCVFWSWRWRKWRLRWPHRSGEKVCGCARPRPQLEVITAGCGRPSNHMQKSHRAPLPNVDSLTSSARTSDRRIPRSVGAKLLMGELGLSRVRAPARLTFGAVCHNSSTFSSLSPLANID